MSKLSDYLNTQIIDRGWSKSELARRAGVSISQTTDVLNERANPGAEFCIAVARALGNPPEEMLRLGGILPPLPPTVADEHEAIDLFRRLSAELRQAIINTMRNLRGIRTTQQLHDNRAEYNIQPCTSGERPAYEFDQQLATMSRTDQDAVWAYVKQLKERSQRENRGSD